MVRAVGPPHHQRWYHQRWRAVLARRLALTCALGAGWQGCGRVELSASRLLEEPLPPPSPPPPNEGGARGLGAGGLGPVPEPLPPYEPAPALFAYKGELRDHCGEPIALRGTSEFIAWTDGGDGEPEFFEMAKVGANAARIMWRSQEKPEGLGPAVDNAVAQGLVAVVEMHETFGSLPEADSLASIMDYWMLPSVVEALRRNEEMLIVELSSWAAPSSPRDQWIELYANAIATFRSQGLRMPIAVVEPSWGADRPDLVGDAMAELLGRDPLGNLLLAFYFWSGTPAILRQRHTALAQAGVASYISEFSEYSIRDCPNSPLDVSGILSAADEAGGSWFAWSWGSVPNAGVCTGYLDLTSDGTASELTPLGSLVAFQHPAGLARGAVAVRTQTLSACPQ